MNNYVCLYKVPFKFPYSLLIQNFLLFKSSFSVFVSVTFINSVIFYHQHHSNDEMPLSVDWVVTGNSSVSIQSPFSEHSVDWMAGTFQLSFSQWPFFENKITPNAAQTRDLGILTIRSRGPWLSTRTIWCV